MMISNNENLTKLLINAPREEIFKKQLTMDDSEMQINSVGVAHLVEKNMDVSQEVRLKSTEGDTCTNQIIPLLSTKTQSPLNFGFQAKPICVFCGMDAELNLGQGELLRFHTKLDYVEPPQWYLDYLDRVKQKQERCSAILQSNKLTHTTRRNQHSKIMIASSPNLSVDIDLYEVNSHVSLDGCLRLKEGKHYGYAIF